MKHLLGDGQAFSKEVQKNHYFTPYLYEKRKNKEDLLTAKKFYSKHESKRLFQSIEKWKKEK